MAETKAETKTPAKGKKQKYQGVDDVFYLRNPAGAIHSVSRDHARVRLGQLGWDMATDTEIETYLGQRVQRSDRPIGDKWTADPMERLPALPGDEE